MVVPAKPEKLSEIWEKIPDFPNYSASTFGRIRGPRGILVGYWKKDAETAYIRLRNPRSLDTCRSCGSERRNGKPRYVQLSKATLILRAFHGRPQYPNQIPGFRDGNRKNFRPANLYWANSLSPESDPSKVLELREKGNTIKQISAAVGMSETYVWNILNKKGNK